MLSAEPAFCRAIIVEVHAAGPAALARRRAVLRVFADRYLEINRQAREDDPAMPELSEDVALGLVGAILELVSTRVEAGRTDALPELAEPLTAFVALTCRRVGGRTHARDVDRHAPRTMPEPE